MTGRLEIARLQRRLDSTFSRAPPPAADLEFQADFAKYLCVLVSGFLENAIAALLLDYVDRRSSPEVTLYVDRQLKYWTNPTTDKIVSLLFSFDATWGNTAAAYLVDSRKESLNSLVALRHKIAHGESVGTSLYQVKQYYATVREIVRFLEDLIEPESAR
jgi:hypothetical protein